MLARSFATANVAGKKVGFIGLGNMGLPMTQNLQKNGFEVKGYDIGEKQRKACQEAGIPLADSIKDAVKDADFIVTALPKTEHVEGVLTMEDGIFDSAQKGAYICDVSTIAPHASKEFNAEAAKRDLVFLDTPMSGGIMGAQKGTLTFMVGGEADQFENAKNVLSGMGTNFFHCGASGAGEVAKLCNNLILGINMIAASEGLAIGEKLGMDPKKLVEICEVSTSRSFVMDTMNPVPGVKETTPASRNYDGGFQVALIKKDLALALEAAQHGNANTDMTEMAINYYRDIEKQGYGQKDFGYVFQYIFKNRKL